MEELTGLYEIFCELVSRLAAKLTYTIKYWTKGHREPSGGDQAGQPSTSSAESNELFPSSPRSKLLVVALLLFEIFAVVLFLTLIGRSRR